MHQLATECLEIASALLARAEQHHVLPCLESERDFGGGAGAASPAGHDDVARKHDDIVSCAAHVRMRATSTASDIASRDDGMTPTVRPPAALAPRLTASMTPAARPLSRIQRCSAISFPS